MPDVDNPPQGAPPADETAAPAARAPDEPQAGRPAVSEESAELYFLIANFLTNASPCSRAGEVLQQELVGLKRYNLPTRLARRKTADVSYACLDGGSRQGCNATAVWCVLFQTRPPKAKPNVRPSPPLLSVFYPKRERHLLGTAYDWESNARPASFDDFRRRHHALPANQLARVATQYLRQQHAGAPAQGGSSSTAIVVAEQQPSSSSPSTGPGVSTSLLSRVEPFGNDREANEVWLS